MFWHAAKTFTEFPVSHMQSYTHVPTATLEKERMRVREWKDIIREFHSGGYFEGEKVHFICFYFLTFGTELKIKQVNILWNISMPLTAPFQFAYVYIRDPGRLQLIVCAMVVFIHSIIHFHFCRIKNKWFYCVYDLLWTFSFSLSIVNTFQRNRKKWATSNIYL